MVIRSIRGIGGAHMDVVKGFPVMETVDSLFYFLLTTWIYNGGIMRYERENGLVIDL